MQAVRKLDVLLDKLKDDTEALITAYKRDSGEFIVSSVSAAPSLDSNDADDSVLKQLRKAHARVSEVLLQGLLKVDGVVYDGDGAERVRARRKEVVRTVNRWLEEVDRVKEEVERCAKKHRNPNM